jgi:hypothetical protein
LYKIISPENLSKFRLVKKISVGCTLFAFVSESSHKIFAVITPSTGSISHVSPAAAFSGTKSSQLQVPALHTHAEAASANKKNPKLVLDEIARRNEIDFVVLLPAAKKPSTTSRTATRTKRGSKSSLFWSFAAKSSSSSSSSSFLRVVVVFFSPTVVRKRRSVFVLQTTYTSKDAAHTHTHTREN